MFRPTQLTSGKWRIRWVDENGVRLSAVFSTKREADYQLGLRMTEVEEIQRGVCSPRPKSKIFHELCDSYLEKRAPLKRYQEGDKVLIGKHLRPFFGGILIHNISTTHIDDYRLAKQQLQPKTVHHHLTLLGTMLRYAHEKKWIREMIKIKKPKITQLNKDFRYLKTKDEVKRFLISAQEEGDLVYTLYATALFTGMRVGELAGLKWDAVDFQKRLIQVQYSYAGPTKSGDIRHIPILDSLLADCS